MRQFIIALRTDNGIATAYGNMDFTLTDPALTMDNINQAKTMYIDALNKRTGLKFTIDDCCILSIAELNK